VLSVPVGEKVSDHAVLDGLHSPPEQEQTDTSPGIAMCHWDGNWGSLTLARGPG
jgi:hypothetical protein